MTIHYDALLIVTEGLAVDWVSNKLYWTESLYRRIEVLDLDTMVRSPILTVDPHSGLRDIAVDPSTRCSFVLNFTVQVLISS